MNKQYICACREEFQSANALNSHKSYCKVHLTAKYGSWDNYLMHKNRNSSFRIEKLRESCNIKHLQYIESKNEALLTWVSQQHKCEHCGKVMTERYGSGRFCSKSCSNTRTHSIVTRTKIGLSSKSSSKVRASIELNKQTTRLAYEDSPNYCNVCGEALPFEIRNRKTCGTECLSSYRKIVCNHIPNNSPRPQFKYGTYKDIHCDSSWELAFVVYNLDNGIHVTRNNKHFSYIYNDEEHWFYPDFIIDNTYYEIKGQWTEKEKSKISQFPMTENLKVIDSCQIGTYIKYCEDNYGKDFSKVLYDKDKPSYLDIK